jgi:hypothetical protein
MRYGSYTTFDAPTQKQDEAFEYLTKEFDNIGGKVRKMYNAHDLGRYLSFEIDFPHHLEDIDDLLEENNFLILEKDKWLGRAEEIERSYNKEFSEYL